MAYLELTSARAKCSHFLAMESMPQACYVSMTFQRPDTTTGVEIAAILHSNSQMNRPGYRGDFFIPRYRFLK